jgi:hypothetical protein
MIISTLMTDRQDLGTAVEALAARLGCDLRVYYPTGRQPPGAPAPAEAAEPPAAEPYNGVECMSEADWRSQ